MTAAARGRLRLGVPTLIDDFVAWTFAPRRQVSHDRRPGPSRRDGGWAMTDVLDLRGLVAGE
ncbi:hypothetical protein GCM10009687_09470 [Asanoa iriomotensis]